MPEMSSAIQLKYGLKSSYTSLPSKDQNTIYFCTDTGEIFVGDTPFSPQIVKDVISDPPENDNTVLNIVALGQAMQSNFNACVQEIHNITDNKLVPSAKDLDDNTYATVKSQAWVAQPMSGTDYKVSRLRGMQIFENVTDSMDTAVPEGCFAAYISFDIQ